MKSISRNFREIDFTKNCTFDGIFALCDLYSLPSGGPMIPFPECIGFRLVFYTHRNAVNVTKKITNYFSHGVFKKLNFFFYKNFEILKSLLLHKKNP